MVDVNGQGQEKREDRTTAKAKEASKEKVAAMEETAEASAEKVERETGAEKVVGVEKAVGVEKETLEKVRTGTKATALRGVKKPTRQQNVEEPRKRPTW